VIQFNGGISPTGATTSEVHGRFVLKRGTGAYPGLHGAGRIHAMLDSASGAITAVYTGKAHVDRGQRDEGSHRGSPRGPRRGCAPGSRRTYDYGRQREEFYRRRRVPSCARA